MSTLTDSSFPNLMNIMKRLSPSGGIADVVDILSKKNPMLEDIPWAEGNQITGHRITQTANSLPTGTWRRFNAGVAATKGETVQYDEVCGMLQAESRIDVDVAKLNGNAAEYRRSEDKIFVEGISQQFATAVMYESVTTNPERIHGLTPRYALSTGGTTSSYVLKPGTVSGTNCHSVWLVTWEPRKLYGIFPKGSVAGLQVEDKGEVYVEDPNDATKHLWAYLTKFQWKCGIAVEDYRYAVRLQWDVDDTTYFGDDDKGMYTYMQAMIDSIYEITPNTRFYMNRTSKAKLGAQLMANQANMLDKDVLNGRPVQTFMGVPIRVTDALVAETNMSA